MSYLQALLIAEARRTGRAQPSATVLHRHLTARPLGIVPFQLGAEPFTAAAVAWGFGAESRKMVVPGEPRDRELSFRALTTFATAFNRWFEGEGRTEPPQIVVPNHGALGHLGRLGRRLAYLRTDGEYPADPALIRLGRHLRFLFERSRFPGQQLVLSMTELLGSCWVTELSDLETMSLPALVAAICPPRGKTPHQAAFEAEEVEIGPLPGGKDDEVMDKLLSVFNEARDRRTEESVVAPLRRPIVEHYERLVDRGWSLLWKALDLVRSLPEAEHVKRRFDADIEALNRHVDWVVIRGMPYRTRQTNEQAARTLRGWEEAQRLLDAEEAVDDPLRMIPTLLANRGVAGSVIQVESDHFEMAQKRKVRRPRVVIETRERCTMPVGKELYWTRTPGKREYVLREIEPSDSGGSRVTLQLETSSSQEMPEEGTLATFSVHHTRTDPPLTLPAELPWTHVEPDDEPEPIESTADAGSWE